MCTPLVNPINLVVLAEPTRQLVSDALPLTFTHESSSLPTQDSVSKCKPDMVGYSARWPKPHLQVQEPPGELLVIPPLQEALKSLPSL